MNLFKRSHFKIISLYQWNSTHVVIFPIENFFFFFCDVFTSVYYYGLKKFRYILAVNLIDKIKWKKPIELAKVTDRLNQIKLNRVLFTTMEVGSNNRSTIPITLSISLYQGILSFFQRQLLPAPVLTTSGNRTPKQNWFTSYVYI